MTRSLTSRARTLAPPHVRQRPLLRRAIASAAASAALLVGAGVAPASAATASCAGPTDNTFFNEPAGAASAPGTVLSCRPATMRFAANLPAYSAWQVIYASRDLRGAPMAVSGAIIVPKAAWRGTGPRPLVALAPGSQGLANGCGFSRQLVRTGVLEAAEMVAFLKAGFAIATTDYQGYLNGQVPTYIVGPPEGTALLDVARAARDLTATGLTSANPVALVGYSQGGQGSLWGAELSRSYAPDVNIVAAVAGGTPGDLLVTARYLNGGLAAGFLFDAIVGLHTAYPELPYDELIDPEGEAAVKRLLTQCFAETLATNIGKRIEKYTVGGIGIDALLDKAGPDGKTWRDALDESTLGKGVTREKVPFPVYMYRGVIDEIIPVSTQDATRRAYCRGGVQVSWKVYPAGDHILTLFQAVNPVTAFLASRFRGNPWPGNC
jgi:dienelactone hydrolase